MSTPDLHLSNVPTAVNTSKASLTYDEHSTTGSVFHLQIPHEKFLKLERAHTKGSDLASEITTRVEEEITRYGGDDIHEPPARTPKNKFPELPPPINDPHMVGWDGPNDPANPQNWSLKYKWFVTIVVIIACMNVYVLIFHSFVALN